MAQDLELIEGQTAAIDLQLKADNVPVDLTGFPVPVLILKGSDGASVDTTGNITILDALTGKLRYFPDAVDLVAVKSPYHARVKATDGVGKIAFFPNSIAPAVWKVGLP